MDAFQKECTKEEWAILVLRYLLDVKLTFSEIAKRLKISQRTAFRKHKQALEKLRALQGGTRGKKNLD